MKTTMKRILCMALCLILLVGIVPVSAATPIELPDAPLTGETGNGWEGIENTSSKDENTSSKDENTSSKDENTSSEDESTSSEDENTSSKDESTSSKDENTSSEDESTSSKDEETPPVDGDTPKEQPALMSARSSSLSKESLTWGGGRVQFSNGAYHGSPITRAWLDGSDAFCVEWNGMVPDGDYEPQGILDDTTILQIVANFAASSGGSAEYMAAQIAIWAHLQGADVESWGGNPAESYYDDMMYGGADTSELECYLHSGDNTTQLLLTFEGGTFVPDEEKQRKLRIEVESKTDTRTDVRNEKTYEYSDAIGQITIRKHDQDGNSLDGALFNIDVAFSDGSHTRVNNWEVDNGARLFTWTHPKDNHDPATVTITEVVPPRYYQGDPTPKKAVVHPTYTRVTHVTTWTVTIVTSSINVAVIDIEGDEVIVESDSSDSAEVTSDPKIEEFADFIAGDRETTVTFVNRRLTGEIEVIKKDANTGLPLAGATIHLKGTDLGDAGQVDKTEVTGANGIAYFRNLAPGTYVIQETQAPFGYNLNSEKQTVALQSGQTIRKEIRNYRKDGLVIKKVDPDGNPIAGAVFELRRGSGEVILSETTDENGTIFRDYLTEGLYVIEEKKAPEGYLLDENPIKEIFIYAKDDNKQYTVTFVNKKNLPSRLLRLMQKHLPSSWRVLCSVLRIHSLTTFGMSPLARTVRR